MIIAIDLDVKDQFKQTKKVSSERLRKPGLKLTILDAICSKLTMSLVNDSLKFQMTILQIQCYFLLRRKKKKKKKKKKKDSHIVSTKIIVYLLLKTT